MFKFDFVFLEHLQGVLVPHEGCDYGSLFLSHILYLVTKILPGKQSHIDHDIGKTRSHIKKQYMMASCFIGLYYCYMASVATLLDENATDLLFIKSLKAVEVLICIKNA